MAPRRRIRASEQPEFGVSDPHWLSVAKNGLSGRFHHHGAEANGSAPCGRRGGGELPSPLQQLLHPGDQLTHHRDVRQPGLLRLRRDADGIHQNRRRRRNLIFVDYRPSFSVGWRVSGWSVTVEVDPFHARCSVGGCGWR